MITKEQYNEVLSKKDLIENPTTEILKLISELQLTPTTDKETLTTEYKSILFKKVMAVDKGLRMRYDLTRTDTSKLDMINQTITLDGYDDLDLLLSRIDSFISLINSEYYFKQLGILPEEFLTVYNGSIQEAFKGKVIDVTDTQEYNKLKTVSDILNDLYKDGTLCKFSFTNGFFRELERYFIINSHSKKISVNEVSVFYNLKK